MTIKRETLELAAKAAGIDLYWQRYYAEDEPTPYTGNVQWSPLTDHGQLHDLAMACDIIIDPVFDQISDDGGLTWANVNCQDFDALSAAVITAVAEQQLAKEGKA